MAYNELLAKRIRNIIEGDYTDELENITEKKMFGGLSFMYKGKMSIGIHTEAVMVRILAEKMEAILAEDHVGPMEFTGKPMKEFVTVAEGGFESKEQLKRWIDLGIEHAEWKAGQDAEKLARKAAKEKKKKK